MKVFFCFSLVSSLAMFWSSAHGQIAVSVTHCFRPSFRHAISNLPPLLELWDVSVDDCLNHCISGETEEQCSTVVYHKNFLSCQLYSQNGTLDGASRVFAKGHDFYARISTEDTCQDRFNNNIRCFQRTVRHSIDNSQPLAEYFYYCFAAPVVSTLELSSLRYFYYSPYQCLDMCIQTADNAAVATIEETGLCRSVVYNHLSHSCRLYGHDGTDWPSVIHPANGFDLYQRTATSQECGGPINRFFVKRRTLSAGKLGKSGMEEKRTQPAIPLPPKGDLRAIPYTRLEQVATLPSTVGKPPIAGVLPKLKTTLGSNKFEVDREPQYYTPITSHKSVSRALDRDQRVVEGCRVAYYKVIGHKMAMSQQKSTYVFRVRSSHLECIKYCTKNEGPEKQKLDCTSFNYYPDTKTCEILSPFTDTINSNPSLLTDESAIYLRKFCLPAHNPSAFECGNERVITLRPGHKMQKTERGDGFDSFSITECLQCCLNHKGCTTASFDSKKNKCYPQQHKATADLAINSSSRWTLIENGCAA